VHDYQLVALAPLLPFLTHLDLYECTNITVLPYHYSPPLKASLKALTSLNLSSTTVGDEGMRTLACLTALADLQLDNTAVTERGVRSLALITDHLTYLALTGEECGELIAVCSLTALTRLETMLSDSANFEDGIIGFSEEGMSALTALTGLDRPPRVG
jgi:hypothetical protein